MVPKRVAIALESATNGWSEPVDGSEEKSSLANALGLLVRPESTTELHLVSVKNRIPAPIPMPSVLSPADREVFCPADQKLDECARVDHLLRDAASSAVFNNYRPQSITIHAIDPEGGVREALVRFCKEHEIELLILGPVRQSKGISGVLRALLGFGSVSEFSLHNLDIPIAVFHGHAGEKGKAHCKGQAAKVLVCVDPAESPDSPGSGSLSLLKWVMSSVGNGDVEIHIVSCALRGLGDIVDEECACAIGEIHQQEDQRDDEMHGLAETAVYGARRVALDLGLGAKDVYVDVLQADGKDASDVVKVLTGYTAKGGFDLVCVGKRGGISGLSRTLNHWLGDGSVSDMLSKESAIPTLIVVPDSLI
jgi:nucleotide-binding universal stress UspA family protein